MELDDREEELQLLLKCVDVGLAYCYEYVGTEPLPVFSPRSNSYFIAFTQVRERERRVGREGEKVSRRQEAVTV